MPWRPHPLVRVFLDDVLFLLCGGHVWKLSRALVIWIWDLDLTFRLGNKFSDSGSGF